MTPRAVFITGAGAGIGRAIAERFAAEGWAVGVYDIDLPAAEAVANSLGERAIAGRLDVADPGQWTTALAEFTSRTGRLDALVNNAGILASGAFGEIPLTDQHRIIDVNVKGVLNGCHAALPHLRRTPGSHVVNMASASALYGQPGLAAYGASKAAVRSLTEALDLEWRDLDVAVHDVLPLFVSTAMMNEVNRGSKSAQTLGVHISPEDVAAEVWNTVSHKRTLAQPHVLVGLQTKVLNTAMSFSPAWLNRLIVGRIAHADEIGARTPD
ncbi:SDR family oxidoreductase [Nocardia huaxiensis]|uniref:SDR family oxidoreductase n=1 Tax=Nocardia huaxiensis TaxID=2755382 RepID=UPI001E41EEC3|nr:SDR family oxidoreductase [Nocardia huaxiensis]UFS98264.1 SDR family oxidoreductase [Nocardia huaxiensis]